MTREDCVGLAGEDLLFADGFDEAIAGVAQRFNEHFVVYDRVKVIDILMVRDGMTDEEAEEFFSFNIVGAWVGDHTPAFMFIG